MSAVSRPTDPGPGRRSVLLGSLGAGAALLTGCSLNNPYSTDRTPAKEAVPDLAPDVGIAVQAVALIAQAQQELDSLIGGRLGTATALAGLTAAYAAYANALRGAVPKGVEITPPSPTTTLAPGPTTPSATVAPATTQAVRHTAATVKARLNLYALRAESGPFARLLGSMAAGLSQQLVVLR